MKKTDYWEGRRGTVTSRYPLICSLKILACVSRLGIGFTDIKIWGGSMKTDALSRTQVIACFITTFGRRLVVDGGRGNVKQL